MSLGGLEDTVGERSPSILGIKRFCGVFLEIARNYSVDGEVNFVVAEVFAHVAELS